MFVQVATPRWVASLLENAKQLIGHLCMWLGESEIHPIQITGDPGVITFGRMVGLSETGPLPHTLSAFL
jgi:hypothetical protein